MPIYEFYCADCHMLFNFFSRSVNTTAQPTCPSCRARKLERQVSLFAAVGGRGEEGPEGDLPVDDAAMEKAMESLAGEAEGIQGEDPRQAARLMRKFSDMTGMKFGSGMEEALGRMEAGEDPDKIEAEMGDRMDEEDPILFPGGKGAGKARFREKPPRRDPTLYEL
jgi:putative FmdB family regulatory protein